MGRLEAWSVPIGILVGAVLLGWLVQAVALSRLAKLSQRTKTDLDDLLLAALRRHVPLWFLIGGATLAARSSPLTLDQQAMGDRIAAALFVLSLSFVAASLITGVVERATARAGGATLISSSLMRNVLRGMILVVGGLMVLRNLGVHIEPLLTALGVGSLAVALALQPTLSNLFAGLHITFARPLRIGDFIELENGIQGFVVDIGWRATQLREGNNNIVIVPNGRLVEMIAKNYSLPEPEQSVPVTVGVGYGSDLERVAAVALEVAKECQASVPEAVKSFVPVVRYQAFGPSSIDFQVVLRAVRMPDRGVVVHEFVKRLAARFQHERIEIPFPQQVVHLRKE
jgi:small-conductance mechanosensitive channel